MTIVELKFPFRVLTSVMLFLRLLKSRCDFSRSLPPVLCERGQALIEIALITPIIFTIWFAVIDLGGVIEQRMTLTRIVNEATRMSASMTNLKPSAPTSNSTRTKAQPTATDPNQTRISDRIQLLLDIESKEGRLRLNPDSISISTRYEDTNSNTVKIQINARFQSAFNFASFFSSFPVTVSDTSAYLY